MAAYSMKHIWHYDNAPSHIALSVRQFLSTQITSTAICGEYLSGLFPCEFYMLQNLKMPLKSFNFESI
jgi:hypothetical protein